MALSTSTSVSVSNPANVTVTVSEYTGPGGNNALVDVHITAPPRFASPAAAGHTAGFVVSGSTVSWLNQTINQGSSKDFNGVFNPGVGVESACATFTVIVSGEYPPAVDFYATATPTVCFP